MNRRDLIRSLVAGMAIPLAPIGIASAAQRTGRRLILVELSGANDGLNTVIPINDGRYFEIRPNIALSKDKVFDIGNDLALNSELRPWILRYNLAIWRLFKVWGTRVKTGLTLSLLLCGKPEEMEAKRVKMVG